MGRCLVDDEQVSGERALADVRAILKAREVFDRMLVEAVEVAWCSGATRVALADALGVHRSQVYRWMAKA